MHDAQQRSKEDLLKELLERGTVLVALDSRIDGVVVPDSFLGDWQLRLNLSYLFGLPIQIDDWGVRASLTFDGSIQVCEIPWESIFLMVSHSGGEPLLFPDDVPIELTGGAPLPRNLLPRLRAKEVGICAL